MGAIVAALSPDARNARSCYDQGASRLAGRFRALAGAPASCRPLVRPNRDYFDMKLPRSSPQVVMIAAFARCLRPESVKATTPRGGCVINRALVESMDWDAVNAWLDR